MSALTWFKVDDGFWSHPKTATLSDAAVTLWVRAGAYSCQHGLTGRVPQVALRWLGTTEAAAELVSAGMWAPSSEGWRFVNWRKWQDGNYRPNISGSVRKAVFARDGYACVFCGSPQDLSLDHILRYRDGGSDSIDNLRVSCMTCNRERG